MHVRSHCISHYTFYLATLPLPCLRRRGVLHNSLMFVQIGWTTPECIWFMRFSNHLSSPFLSYDKQVNSNPQLTRKSDTAVTLSRSASGSSSETLWCNFILTCNENKKKANYNATGNFIEIVSEGTFQVFCPPFPLRPNIIFNLTTVNTSC